MILVVIIFSVIYISLIAFIVKTYYKNIQELEQRILTLEKRDNGKITKEKFDNFCLELFKELEIYKEHIKELEKKVNKCEKQKNR